MLELFLGALLKMPYFTKTKKAITNNIKRIAWYSKFLNETCKIVKIKSLCSLPFSLVPTKAIEKTKTKSSSIFIQMFFCSLII